MVDIHEKSGKGNPKSCVTEHIVNGELFSIAFKFILEKTDNEGLQKCYTSKGLDDSREYKGQHGQR